MAKKEVETSKSNTYSLELSNKRTWMDFIDKESLEMFPGRNEWRQKLIYTMFLWAEKSTSLEILQFCMEYKIPYTTLKDWIDKYPDIKQAYNNVKLAIACHRRLGSMNKKLDGAYAYKDMHIYDPEWHAVNKYHSDMKTEEAKQSHTFIISDAKPRIVSKEEMLEGQE
ncbi:MAG TPA: hypothetical protein VII94_01315 [Candidatus Saccharimonadales bacterium]